MKVNRTISLVCLMCIGLGLITGIDRAVADEGGWGGEINLGGATMAGRSSQLEVDEDNRNLSNLDDTADTEYAAEPFLSGELHYTLSNLGTTLFLNAENGSAEFAGGIEQSLGDVGQIRVAALLGEDEAWKDPYLTGVKRQETDVVSYGLSLGYAEILGTGAFVTSTLRVIDVEKDEIGAREKKLRRDGARYIVEAGYRLPLSETSELTPALWAESQEMKGAANASDGAGASLTYGWSNGHWLFETTAGVGCAEYREAHPVFDKKRKATTYEVSTLIGYEIPLGASAVTLFGMAGYERTDENITFFDSEGWMAGLGAGVRF